jgi:hypothetical protein
LGVAGLAGLAARYFWPEQGLLNPCLPALPPELAGHRLVSAAWAGLDPADVWDSHAHLLGGGDESNAADASYNYAHGTLRWPLLAAQRYFFAMPLALTALPLSTGRTSTACARSPMRCR